MALVGFGLAYLFRHELPSLARWPGPRAVGTGLLTAAATMGLTTLLYRSSKRFEQALRESGTRVGQEALELAGYPVMFVMVIMAGFGEEVLFRGGLQPTIGLIPAALLFGFSHGGWRREMWAYVVAAAVSGGVFGLVYWWTGDLWVPVIAHAGHNALSTVLLGRRIDVSWKGRIPWVRLVREEDTAMEPTPTEPVRKAQVHWDSPFPQRPGARESGLITGILPTGPQNDLCDVPGVLV
ncbi:MAG: aminopeptidase-like protein, partial [Firmicutes bacterium]|nr:aminopeptidase-like protein [Bacillota bacterium]